MLKLMWRVLPSRTPGTGEHSPHIYRGLKPLFLLLWKDSIAGCFKLPSSLPKRIQFHTGDYPTVYQKHIVPIRGRHNCHPESGLGWLSSFWPGCSWVFGWDNSSKLELSRADWGLWSPWLWFAWAQSLSVDLGAGSVAAPHDFSFKVWWPHSRHLFS